MKTQVKVTWTLHGTRNAACIGNDETVTVAADSAATACKEVAEDHLHRYTADWETGRFDLMAENTEGEEVYGIEFCD